MDGIKSFDLSLKSDRPTVDQPMTFASEELPPLEDVEITEEDAIAAHQAWQDNPPDDEFTNLLDAEEL